MPDIIKLLPDSIANQIAAGEVIQRPASVVKELVENAIDAGATHIQVYIKDAGRTLIQVVDDGKGMSGTDARMAFERHATSKISSAEDLFNLHTKGFRGEALASIASVAQIELTTRLENSELGTLLQISGTVIENQETVACNSGSNFKVKNLFYNIPARRKFLKNNNVEFRHIIQEIQRIALVNPEVSIDLTHNGDLIYDMPTGTFKQRIAQIFGNNLVQKLVDINVETSVVKISGFIGKPENAKKKSGEQYFFANGRYIKHPYFYKAIVQAYDNLLSPESYPSFFLNLDVDPHTIDVNIHPTKTEVKFEAEQAIWPILMAAVRESLGKFNLSPSIDFDRDDFLDIPVLGKETEIKLPEVKFNHGYDPFESERKHFSSGQSYKRNIPDDWQKLYSSGKEIKKEDLPFVECQSEIDELTDLMSDGKIHDRRNCLQYKNKYLITQVKSGLMFIDFHLAHQRIIFEEVMSRFVNGSVASQKVLFPETFDLSHEQAELLHVLQPKLTTLGFEIDRIGQNSFAINSIPSELTDGGAAKVLEELLQEAEEVGEEFNSEIVNNIVAINIAKKNAVRQGKIFDNIEMDALIDKLFACSNPNYSPQGEPVLVILPDDDIDGLFC